MKTLYGLTEAQMREVRNKVLAHDITSAIILNGGYFDYTPDELFKMLNIDAIAEILDESFFDDIVYDRLPDIIEVEIDEYKRLNKEE